MESRRTSVWKFTSVLLFFILALCVLAFSQRAHAGHVDLNVGIGIPLPGVAVAPPVYVAPPPPVYVAPPPAVVYEEVPVYRHHHKHYKHYRPYRYYRSYPHRGEHWRHD